MNSSAGPPSEDAGAGGDLLPGSEATPSREAQPPPPEQAARRSRNRRWLLGCAVAAVIVLSLLGVGAFFGTKFLVTTYRGAKELREANALAWQRKFEDAVPLYTAAQGEFLEKKDRAVALGNRGWCYANLFREADAIRDYDAALALNPQLKYIVLDRGIAFHRRGQFDRALADYSRALELDPNLPDAYRNRSMILAHLGRWTEAVSDMNEAIRCDPDNPQWFARRGDYYLDGGNLGSALASFESALRLDPENEESYRGQAIVFARRHDQERGLAAVNDALRLKPESARLLSARAEVWLDLFEPAKALDDMDAAIDQGGTHAYAYAYAQRALTEAWLKQYSAALRDVIESLRRNPHQSLAHFARGYTYEKQHKYKEAVAEYGRAVECDSEAAWAVARRASTKGRSGDYESARKGLQEAVKTFPGLVNPHSALGWFLATCPEAKYRDGATARREAQLAVDFSAADPYMLDTLAAACAEAADFQQAQAVEEQALQKLPPLAPGRSEIEQRLKDFAAGKPYRDQP
ncbi:MAG: tetratricopeptide repeat protein [Chthoniobacterales bacterium]